MNAKEKAKELMAKFQFVYIPNYTSQHEVKECAIICVEEIMQATEQAFIDDLEDANYSFSHTKEYWQQVKTEIEKL
jgi:hypothetical protein